MLAKQAQNICHENKVMFFSPLDIVDHPDNFFRNPKYSTPPNLGGKNPIEQVVHLVKFLSSVYHRGNQGVFK